MDRRSFLAATAATVGGGLSAQAQNYSDYTQDPRPDVPEGTCTAGSLDGPVLAGSPMVMGPAADAISILQPMQRMGTGYLEFAVADGPWQRVDGGHAGLLPLSEHVLKFRLPPLPPGQEVRYRIVAHTIGWVKVRQFYHGELKAGEPQTSEVRSFRTLDPDAATTNFVVWNDTHENSETLKQLHERTSPLRPDFMLWNGDQSNDLHFEQDMAGQILNPAGLAVGDQWPIAYVRGNHECRGPAAPALAQFTGAPDDRYYYGFRSGPLAAIVMDTGEDKPDDSPYFGGMAAYGPMQERQAEWLKAIVQEPWFRDAPHKALFCHIPLWFRHPKLTANAFDGHRHCRGLWEKTLVDAGVKLVISGHTHDYLWMPADANRPIGQLIGGAPQPAYATLIEGTATHDELNLKMTKLDGSLVAEVKLTA